MAFDKDAIIASSRKLLSLTLTTLLRQSKKNSTFLLLLR